ncbi:acyltransferase [Nevskia sp.]|uniref:acyltransferase n=1 Tax=Nevskia sp. TaxID=1929292 RepID=UPI0025F30F99|nr:acyltransferase [Nevskia sp.]
MKRWLPAPVIGCLTFVTMFIVLMIWAGMLILPAGIVKLLLPFPPLTRQLDRWIAWCANHGWVGWNQRVFQVLHGRRENCSINGALDPARSWMIVSNHQSWSDILILFDVMYGRTPFPRFFLKRELIWIPLVGFVCWALDMPFMKRNSAAAIAKNPGLRNSDLETTRQFCEKFKRRPIAVVNFLEGTRYTPEKAAAKGSPYRHLLRPKSGGFSFTLNAMGEQFAGLVDVTIVYRPTGNTRSKLWSWLCGEQNGAFVQVDVKPLPAELLGGDYQDDAAFRERFQDWVNGLWADKDALIARQL